MVIPPRIKFVKGEPIDDYFITVVSGYWPVKHKYSGIDYITDWFQNSLPINAPYVFFSTPDILPLVSEIRGDYPTHCREYYIDDFYVNRFLFDSSYCHPVNVPSVELGKIWLEKMYLVEQAAEENY